MDNKQITDHPEPGTIVSRDEFNPISISGSHDGNSWLLSTNHECHGSYGASQEVEILGLMLSVWSKTQANVVNADFSGDLIASVEKLAADVDGRCQHSSTVELSPTQASARGVNHFGNCFHVYRCQDCDHVFGMDSSG